MSRRKSTVHVARAREQEDSPALELERLEQASTLLLQEIDHNLSRANAIIGDSIFPVLKKYAAATAQASSHVGFWKHFLEEAADVEISTVEEPLQEPTLQKQESQSTSRKTDSKKKNDLQPLAASTPPSSDRHIETSTPQLRRTLPSSPQLVAVSGGQVAVSPRKRTPRAADARLLVLQNFLNSSPTLPEPPVLLSEIGRAHASSSSAQPRALSPHSDLGRLLPIALPPVLPAATPARQGSPQRFPLTPNFGSSAARAPPRSTTQFADVSDLPAPTQIARQDESDLLPLPRLQTVAWGGETDDLNKSSREEQGSPKRRRMDNVFLERNEFHSVEKTRSMSDIFDEVLLEHIPGIDQEKKNTEAEKQRNAERGTINGESEENIVTHTLEAIFEANLPTNPKETIGEDFDDNLAEGDLRGRGAGYAPAAFTRELSAESSEIAGITSTTPLYTTANLDAEETRAENANESHTGTNQNLSHSLDSNTSDLGSFLGERWKSLAKSLHKR